MDKKEATEIKDYYKLCKIIYPAWMIILLCALVLLVWKIIIYGNVPLEPGEVVAIKVISITFLITIFLVGFIIFLESPAWYRDTKLRTILKYAEYSEPDKRYEGTTLFYWYYRHIKNKWKFSPDFKKELKQIIEKVEKQLNER